MKSTIIFKSSEGNLYLYDFIKKEMKPCHHLIYICSLMDNNHDPKDLSHDIKDKYLNLYTNDEIDYYCNKYFYLKNKGYFSSFIKEEFLKIEEREIEEVISNINNIVFEVTDACNLQCKYCAYGNLYNDYDLRTNKKMTFDTIKAVFEYLLPFWDSNANKSANQIISIGFYGGEPLMNFKLIEKTVEYCKSMNIPNRRFLFTMTTNATLIDKYVDFLYENKFKITISIDGDEEANSYRVYHDTTASFHKVFNNIKMIQNRYPEYFSKYISFNSVLHNRNSIEKTHRFIHDNFKKTPEIHSLSSSGIKSEKINEFKEMFINYNESDIDENIIKERFTSDAGIFSLCQFLLWYGNNQFYDYETFLYSDNKKIMAHTGTCFPFSKKMYITVNDKILPCEKIGIQYALGTIVNGKVNLNLDSIAQKYNNYYSQIFHSCKECYMINGCRQCIFQLDLTKKYPNCNGFCEEKDILYYLRKNIDRLERKNVSMTELLDNVFFS